MWKVSLGITLLIILFILKKTKNFFFQSGCLGYPLSSSIDEGDFELLILFLPHPGCWSLRYIPPQPVCVVQGKEPRSGCRLANALSTELCPYP